MRTLAGILCVRNGDLLDYCWREAAESLMGVCDELVLSDCDSSDGTREAMNEMASKDERITLCSYPWSDPRATSDWYPEWINYARQHAKSQHVLHLDADELVHEDDYNSIRRAADDGSICFFHRYNFWKDARHLIPEGVCCGVKVLRMAPSNMPIPSDYPWAPAEETMRRAVESPIKVYHYGFIRRREAFFRKAREVQRIWCDSFDPRLEAAEKFDGPWSEMPGVTGWENDVVPFEGSHPKAIQRWLSDRQYKI